jgi:[NiFe] hydrogenase assembly HybE family chaperone
MDSPGEADDHPRVQALIERFRLIDAAMRDLPLYNPQVAIEAVGFRRFGDDALVGVVLTPWFMNLTILPIEPAPMDMAGIGRSVVVELLAGQRTFVTGGDEAIGLYKAHSLHSPVLTFTLPGQARAEALRALALLMAPPAQPAATSAPARSGVDRRALLFGRRPASTPAPRLPD